jgi:hypothetical protein
MLAIAVFSVTLAICRPRTELWPTYLAVTWVYFHASAHDLVTHELIAQEFTSPAVIRDVLADPSVAALPRIHAATDPRKALLDEIVIEVHPSNQGYRTPTTELTRVVVESATPSDAVIVRDALMIAYLRHRKSGNTVRGKPALPERVPHPLFDRPWKFRLATTLGLLLAIIALIVPIPKSKRLRLAVLTVLTVGLLIGLIVWWLMTHPYFYFNIGGFRIL